MTQTDVSLSAELRPIRRRPRALRLLHMSLMTVCALLMGTIILSHPKVQAPLKALLDPASTEQDTTQAADLQIATFTDPLQLAEAPKDPEMVFPELQSWDVSPQDHSASQPQQAKKPVVTGRLGSTSISAMPRDRTPVRRGGF